MYSSFIQTSKKSCNLSLISAYCFFVSSPLREYLILQRFNIFFMNDSF